MYGTAASIFYRNLGSDGWPRHYYPNQNTYELERYLLLEYVKTDLYERQKRLGMLSPHAEPFILETKNLARETEQQFTMDNNNNVSHYVETETKTEKVQDTKNITKEKIASALQVDIETIKLNNEQNQIEEKWIEVKEGVRKSVIQKKHQEVKEEIVRRGETDS